MITIQKSPSADTRSADHVISKQELLDSSRMHIADVRRALTWCIGRLMVAALNHDRTKIDKNFDGFYEQFHRAQQTGEWGKGWFDEVHIVEERHHLNDRCPEDVDLFDVLEMLCDNVMAGLARSGKYRDEGIDGDMLVRAYRNTARKLLENVEVRE